MNVVYLYHQIYMSDDMEPINAVYIKEENISEDSEQEDLHFTDRSKSRLQQNYLVSSCEQSDEVEKLQVTSTNYVGSGMSDISISNESISRDSPSQYTCFNLYSFKKPSINGLGCACCTDMFSSLCSLKKHVFTHISAISTPLYVCTYCSEIFKDMTLLHIHKCTNRSSQGSCDDAIPTYVQKFSSIKPGSNIINKDPDTSYNCSNSCRKYPPSVGEICGKSFTASCKVIVHKKIDTVACPFACEICKKSFSSSGTLKRHKRIHMGERPYACEICGKMFIESGSLMRHKRIHTGECPYSCKICGKSFKVSGRLKEHKRSHTTEQPYTCETCGKSFTVSSSLTRHNRIHTGERSYGCDTCGKLFKDSGNLVSHKRIHTGERPYVCEICGKSFTVVANLISHKTTHTSERPYACEICGKSFKVPRTLSNHKRIHTGERPYNCEICGKSFRVSSNLTSHKKIHKNQ